MPKYLPWPGRTNLLPVRMIDTCKVKIGSFCGGNESLRNCEPSDSLCFGLDDSSHSQWILPHMHARAHTHTHTTGWMLDAKCQRAHLVQEQPLNICPSGRQIVGARLHRIPRPCTYEKRKKNQAYQCTAGSYMYHGWVSG